MFQSLLADLNRFKIEDIPPRLEMRKKALRLFDEIQVLLLSLSTVFSALFFMNIYAKLHPI